MSLIPDGAEGTVYPGVLWQMTGRTIQDGTVNRQIGDSLFRGVPVRRGFISLPPRLESDPRGSRCPRNIGAYKPSSSD